MADITVTAAQVGLVDPLKAIVKSYLAGVTITKGQAVYINSAGKLALADGNSAGCYQFRGIALNGGALNQAIDVCEEGELYGFTLAGAYDSLVYVSDTVGALADAAGTVTIAAGRVVPLSDSGITKVLRVFTRRESDWA